MHLMRWQQFFPQIFLCSYPFPVHLKSIFVAGASQKVAQSKTKLTLLIYVRSEEDDPLRSTPLDIYLLYYLLRGLFPRFLPLGRIIIKEWGSSPMQRLKFSPPHPSSHIIFIFYFNQIIQIVKRMFNYPPTFIQKNYPQLLLNSNYSFYLLF